MHMAVVLYKHCFRINSLKNCKDISRSVRSLCSSARASSILGPLAGSPLGVNASQDREHPPP